MFGQFLHLSKNVVKVRKVLSPSPSPSPTLFLRLLQFNKSVFSPVVEYCGQKRCTAAEHSGANSFPGSRLVANQQQPFMEKTSNANSFLTCPDIDSLPSTWRADLQLIPHNDTGQRERKAEANWDQRGQGFFFSSAVINQKL